MLNAYKTLDFKKEVKKAQPPIMLRVSIKWLLPTQNPCIPPVSKVCRL